MWGANTRSGSATTAGSNRLPGSGKDTTGSTNTGIGSVPADRSAARMAAMASATNRLYPASAWSAGATGLGSFSSSKPATPAVPANSSATAPHTATRRSRMPSVFA